MIATERPILFSGEMVRAILDGRKSQTRRIVKPQPPVGCDYGINGTYSHALCFKTGSLSMEHETKWVFPTPKSTDHRLPCPYGKIGDRLYVRETFTLNNDGAWCYRATDALPKDRRWVPSIHMPRKASRITLEITDVRVERLQEISEEDAVAEGCCIALQGHDDDFARNCYRELWESINGEGSWAANPWVWVIVFRRTR